MVEVLGSKWIVLRGPVMGLYARAEPVSEVVAVGGTEI